MSKHLPAKPGIAPRSDHRWIGCHAAIPQDEPSIHFEDLFDVVLVDLEAGRERCSSLGRLYKGPDPPPPDINDETVIEPCGDPRAYRQAKS